jgi:hypothetical protein
MLVFALFGVIFEGGGGGGRDCTVLDEISSFLCIQNNPCRGPRSCPVLKKAALLLTLDLVMNQSSSLSNHVPARLSLIALHYALRSQPMSTLAAVDWTKYLPPS